MSARACFTSSSLKGLMMASIFFMRPPGASAGTVLAAAPRRNGDGWVSENAGRDSKIEVGPDRDAAPRRRSRQVGRDAEAVGLEVGRKLHVVELEIGARSGREGREMRELPRLLSRRRDGVGQA